MMPFSNNPNKGEKTVKYFTIFCLIALAAMVGMVGCGGNDSTALGPPNDDDVVRMVNDSGENSMTAESAAEATSTTMASAPVNISADILGASTSIDGTTINSVPGREQSRYCTGGGCPPDGP